MASLAELIAKQKEQQLAAAASVAAPTASVPQAASAAPGVPVEAVRQELPVASSEETPTVKIPKEQADEFLELLRSIQLLMDDPDSIQTILRTIMIELQTQPQFVQLMQPEDFGLMIRAMHKAMGIAQIRKTETRSKSAGRKTKLNEVKDLLSASIEELGGLTI